MTARQFKIDPEIIKSIPGLRVLLFTLHDIDQSNADLQAKCQSLLKKCWLECANLFKPETSSYATVQSHPQLAAWRLCFKSLGINVKSHVCSVESLAKRAAKSPDTPRSIIPLVDFYNAISVRHMVPFGAFDLSDLTEMSLRFTKEGDTFQALDSGTAEALPVGEAAYCNDPNTVITRHINYKQSRFGLINQDSKNAVFMAELLPSVDEAALQKLCSDLTEQCLDLFNQKIEIKMISTTEPISY